MSLQPATTLPAALALMPAASDWDPRVHAGLPAGGEALPLAALAGDPERLAEWCAVQVEDMGDPDGKLGPAFLAGSVAWAVSLMLAHLHLGGESLPGLSPETLTLIRRPVTWTEEATGRERLDYVFDLSIAAAGRVAPAGADAALGPLVTELHRALVEALFRQSGLPRAALWRLVGDGLSGALLAAGRVRGRAEEAMAIARAILADRALPLYSRQTGFVRIELPDLTDAAGAPVGDWFRQRGGCCRYYTTEGGGYCTTCVLRDAESRDERLRTYLRGLHG